MLQPWRAVIIQKYLAAGSEHAVPACISLLRRHRTCGSSSFVKSWHQNGSKIRALSTYLAKPKGAESRPAREMQLHCQHIALAARECARLQLHTHTHIHTKGARQKFQRHQRGATRRTQLRFERAAHARLGRPLALGAKTDRRGSQRLAFASRACVLPLVLCLVTLSRSGGGRVPPLEIQFCPHATLEHSRLPAALVWPGPFPLRVASGSVPRHFLSDCLCQGRPFRCCVIPL